jgi:hypothetical protein
MKHGSLAALAWLSFVAVGCSRLDVPKPTLTPVHALQHPTSTLPSTIAPTALAALTSGRGGPGLGDLPSGWATVTGFPPTGAGSVMPRLANCLGVKLEAVTAETFRVGQPTFRSQNGKEWLTGSAGPATAGRGRSIPPPADAALRWCAAAAVAQDLTANGFGPVSVRAVSMVGGFSAAIARSLDVAVTARVSVFGLSGTMFVDLVWIATDRAAAVLDVVDEVFHGDLQSADHGLVDQATDAVARRISGQ